MHGAEALKGVLTQDVLAFRASMLFGRRIGEIASGPLAASPKP